MREWNRNKTVLSGLATMLACALAAGCGGTGSSGLAAAPTIDNFGSFSAADGTTAVRRVASVSSGLRMFTYPDAINTPVLAAIQGAKKTIDVQVYMLTDDDLVQALIAAAKPPRNVRVRVLLEANPFTGTPGPTPSPSAAGTVTTQDTGGSFNPNSKAMRSLRGTPVQAAWSSPQFVYTHEKAMIIDKGLVKQAVWIMTANMSKAARINNREYLVVDSNEEDIVEAQHIFDSDWGNKTYTPGPAAAHLVISPNNSRAQLMGLIESATKTLSIGVESYGDPEIQQRLINKAKAGVQVQVLLADPTKYPDSPIPGLARELKAGGCRVKYAIKPYYHAKTIIADNQTVYTGSINFSTNSMNNNRELGILYSQTDLVQQVVKTYAQDFAGGHDIEAAPKLSTPQFSNSDELFDS